MAKLVAIHQPNFFPWLGYFDKLARADVFILLDHVQYPKTKGSWGNRVQMLVGRQARFVTMPIRRDYHGLRRCNEILTSAQISWREDLLKTLRANYGRANHFGEVFSFVEPLVLNPIDNLAVYNVAAVTALARELRIDTAKMVPSSRLGVEAQATDMLVDLIRAVGGDAYLNGGGAAGYLEPEKFAAAGITLVQQDFQHPVYPQVGGMDFVPGLSFLDALFNVGFAATTSLLGWAPQAKTTGNVAA